MARWELATTYSHTAVHPSPKTGSLPPKERGHFLQGMIVPYQMCDGGEEARMDRRRVINLATEETQAQARPERADEVAEYGPRNSR